MRAKAQRRLFFHVNDDKCSLRILTEPFDHFRLEFGDDLWCTDNEKEINGISKRKMEEKNTKGEGIE